MIFIKDGEIFKNDLIVLDLATVCLKVEISYLYDFLETNESRRLLLKRSENK